MVRRGIAPGKYDEMVNLPGLSYVWANAPASVANYYAVTSRDATGLESEYSNELRVLPTPRPTAPNLKTAVPVTVEIKRRRGFERGAYFANIRTISE